MASNLLNRAVQRPVKTCTQCKQVKLRCDSKEKFPAPCTRCQTRNLQCVVDSSFRRTPARKRVEDMAKELEALRSRRTEDAAQSLTESPSVPGSSPDNPPGHPGKATVDETGLDQDQFQLEDFVIDRETVVGIFSIFGAFYYPHLPILEPHIDIAAIYESSPLLFWVVIVITTARAILPSFQELHEPSREPFLRRFQSEILSAPLPLQTIQAIAYLTVFPQPMPTQAMDPSWLYSGIAVNAATYMGLHRAKPAQSLRVIGVSSGSAHARANTWLGCFVASTALAMHVGVSSPIRGSVDLATVEQFVRSHPVPKEFAYQIMIHHTLAKFFNTIVENSQENLSHSLVKIIDAELDSLITRYPTPWTPRTETANLTAKMLLYTTVIIRLQSDRTAREILMRNGLAVAVRIVYLMDQGIAYESKEFPNVPSENLQRTLPKSYFRTLVLATTFLLRFFVLNIHATPEEQEMARNQVAIARRFLEVGAMGPKDERMRGAKLFERLSRQQPVDLDSSKLKVDDRMGASLYYDAVATGHALRHEPIEVEKASPKVSVDASVKSSVPPVQPLSDISAQLPSMDDIDMNGYGTIDFSSLPEDLWGDSIWGMFGNMAPPAYPMNIAPGDAQNSYGYGDSYNQNGGY